MSDVIFIAALIAFFVICALYVHLSDRMIGRDDPAAAGQGIDTAIDSGPATMIATSAGADGGVTAGGTDPHRAAPQRRRAIAMT